MQSNIPLIASWIWHLQSIIPVGNILAPITSSCVVSLSRNLIYNCMHCDLDTTTDQKDQSATSLSARLLCLNPGINLHLAPPLAQLLLQSLRIPTCFPDHFYRETPEHFLFAPHFGSHTRDPLSEPSLKFVQSNGGGLLLPRSRTPLYLSFHSYSRYRYNSSGRTTFGLTVIVVLWVGHPQSTWRGAMKFQLRRVVG